MCEVKETPINVFLNENQIREKNRARKLSALIPVLDKKDLDKIWHYNVSFLVKFNQSKQPKKMNCYEMKSFKEEKLLDKSKIQCKNVQV